MGCTTSTNSSRTIHQQNDLPNGNVKDTVGALPNGNSSHDTELHKPPAAIDANGGHKKTTSPLKSSSSSSSSSSASSLSGAESKVNQTSADTGQTHDKSNRDNNNKDATNTQKEEPIEALVTVVAEALPSAPPIDHALERVARSVEQVRESANSLMADEEVDIDLNDPEVGKAAVKIQAGFKNYMARKKDPKEGDEAKKSDEKEEDKDVEEGIADIDLNDPEMEKAATKIQATFRGYKTRLDNDKTRKDTGSSAIEAK